MRHILAFGLAALPSIASALTITYEPPPSHIVADSPDAIFGEVYQTTGSVHGIAKSPFDDETTPYWNIEAGGAAYYSLAAPTDTWSMIWGSRDAYQEVTFYANGVPVDSYSCEAGADCDGSNDLLSMVSFTMDEDVLIDGVVLETWGNSFEHIALAPIPLPASLAMLGAALLSFLGLRRRGLARSSAQFE